LGRKSDWEIRTTFVALKHTTTNPIWRFFCLLLTLAFPVLTLGGDSIKQATSAYRKNLYDRVGRRWYLYAQQSESLLSAGTVQITLRITPEGKVVNLKVNSNSANQAAAQIAVQAIKETKLRPIPKAVLNDPKTANGFVEEFTFTVFPAEKA
jgi:TonB family protein